MAHPAVDQLCRHFWRAPVPVVSNAQRSVAFVCAIAMSVALVWAGGEPAASELFVNDLHWYAHFGAFAIFAVLWMYALPGVSALTIALAVVGFGFAHELYEIYAHAHAFELIDAVVDAAGGITGVLVTRLFWSYRAIQLNLGN